MPKVPINYSKTVIYKLVCNNIDVIETYVGHTTSFVKRNSSHQSICHNPKSKGYNFYVYQFIRANGGFVNWKMIEIEKFPCNDRFVAKKRERFYIEQLHATLNSNIPSRTLKEYYEDNKEERLKYIKKHYHENKEAYDSYRSIPHICECGCNYTYANRLRHMRSLKHHKNVSLNNIEYVYQWDDGTPCTKQEYDDAVGNYNSS